MKLYDVTITETLEHVETVKAHSKEEAEAIVQKMYEDEEIVLYAENLTQTEFEVTDSD